jgi:hypothetical protein
VKLRRIVIAAVGAAALIVAAGVVVSFLPTRSGHSVAQTVLGGAATPRATDAGTDGGTHAGRPSTSQPSKSPKQDNSLITDVGKGGLEQIPTATPTPYRLHPTNPPTSLAAKDITAAPDSKVTTKATTTVAGSTDVLIDATTTSKPSDTIAYYQSMFTSLGLTGKPVPAVGGSTAIAFSNDSSTVTLTVSAHDKGSHYLIHGVLRTGA